MAKDFSAAIDEIMPLVQDGDKSTPFIISRNPGDVNSPWIVEYPYPAESAGEKVLQRREIDPYAVIYRGADFDGGSFPEVHDMVLCGILRSEYYDYVSNESYTESDKKRISALINFAEDNIRAFSNTTVGYLMEIDKPFAALDKFCPFNLATGKDGWTFNEDLAADAVDQIEQRIEVEIAKQKDALTERDAKFSDDKVNKFDPAHIISTIEISGYEIEIGEDTEQPEPYYVETSKDGKFTFGLRSMRFTDALEAFIGQINERTVELQRENNGKPPLAVMTAEHCLPDSRDADFTGKLVIVDVKSLKPEYRSSENQIILCTHGNGARPNAIGRSVFCKELYSGDSVVFDRSQILGVADESKLPQWAKMKLEIQRDPAVFEYGGYHFKPYRKFERRDGDFHKQMRNVASDRSMGISSYEWGKTEYSHAKFYETAQESEADIFRCLENGKLYIPAANELFRYNEPLQKEQTKTAKPPKTARAEEKPQKKPSILSDLDDAIAEAARIAERKGGNHTKKRGDMEVE